MADIWHDLVKEQAMNQTRAWVKGCISNPEKKHENHTKETTAMSLKTAMQIRAIPRKAFR
jgi:hypothetical protein